jgi:hypothetical protein
VNDNGKKTDFKLYQIKTLKIGGLELRDETVTAMSFSGKVRAYLGTDTPIELGLESIRKANWIFDMKRRLWDVIPGLPD